MDYVRKAIERKEKVKYLKALLTMPWKTHDLVFFMFLAFSIGWNAQKLYQLRDSEPKRIAEHEKVNQIKTIYCSLGMLGVINHYLDDSQPMPNCDFRSDP